MTKENYEALMPYKDLMRTIIINSAASNLPIGYKIAAETAGKEYGIHLSCNCSSGWFTLTSRIYKEFLKFSNENFKEQEKLTNENSNEKTTESPDRKSSRKNRRK